MIEIKPNYLSFAITWRCNSRCKVCNTWKISDHDELTLEEIKNAFENNSFGELNEAVLTGGEPFLRSDILSIAKSIHENTGSSIGVTTNGLLPEKIVEFTSSMLEYRIPVGIYVSLDGPEEIHDSLRGVRGSFNRSIGLLKKLTSIKDDNLTVSTGMTISRENISFIKETDRICRNLDVEMSVRLSEYGGFFHNNGVDMRFSDKEREKIIKSVSLLDHDEHLKSYYQILIRFLESGRYEPFVCGAAKSSLMIDPIGGIYPCPTLMESHEYKIGSLRERSFDGAWKSSNADYIRKKISGCCNCLNISKYFWGLNLRTT